MAYIVPQVLIRQLISEVSLNTVQNQNVLVIGPNYQLNRYSDADEKAKIFIGMYDGKEVVDDEGKPVAVDGVVEYPDLLADTSPDASYTKIFADNVVVRLFDANGFTKLEDDETGSDLDGRLKFDFALTGRKRGYEVITIRDESNEIVNLSYGDTKLYDLERDIAPGDVIRIPYGKDDEGNDLVFQSTILAIFSSVEGNDIIDSVQVEDTLPEEIISALESNDQMYEGTVTFCAMFSGAEINRKSSVRNVYNWETYEDKEDDIYGVKINPSVDVKYTNWGAPQYLQIISAKFYLEYRTLIRASSTDIMTIARHTDVEKALGTIHPDNPLAFGTYMAALNCGDRLVYYCGVATDDLAGYNEVLGKASLTDEVYFIVPLTTDEGVIYSVRDHVEAMSSKENKLWRIGFVSTEPPTTDVIYDAAANVDNFPFYAKFIESSKTKGKYNLMQFTWDDQDDRPNTVVKCLSDVEAGDTVKVYTENADDYWDDTPGYIEYRVKKVVSNTVLQLVDGVSFSTFDPKHLYKVEVYRKLNHTRQAKYIADLSSKLATRRMYNVFPSVAITDGVSYGGEFLAAAAAGLASSVLPQQPITNVELNGVSDIPMVYQTFSREELNTIAEGGTFIVMQDRPGSKVYVRHQISTAYSDNNLLKAELSVTKNLDSISYYFAELFAPLIGKYNITPELIGVVRTKLLGGLTALETSTAAGLIGPQVLAEGTEILALYQSTTNKDHIYAKVHLNLPVPFNYFDLDLEI